MANRYVTITVYEDGEHISITLRGEHAIDPLIAVLQDLIGPKHNIKASIAPRTDERSSFYADLTA